MSGNHQQSPIFKQLLTNIAKLFLAIIESDKKVFHYKICNAIVQCDIRKEVLCEIKRFKPAEFFEGLCAKAAS
jgi:hypothetical protein